MKRRIVLLVAVVALAANASDVVAKSLKDKAHGNGRDATGDRLHVNAQSGPDGEEPKGHVRVRFTFNESKGKVDCIHVEGNRAALSGPLDEPIDEPGPGQGNTRFFVVIEDNGKKSDIPDRFGLGSSPPEATPPADCGFSLFSLPLVASTGGDLVVEDE